MTNLLKLPRSRKRRSSAPLLADAGHVRARRYIARRFALPIETAVLVAEAAGIGGGR